MLAGDTDVDVAQRLAAEIDELCPGLAFNAAWLASREGDFGSDLGTEPGLALAAELDRRAAGEDTPDLRSVADCVRLLSLPTPRDTTHFADHRRVAKSLLLALHKVARGNDDEELCSELERFCFGWAALPCCNHMLNGADSAVYAASIVGARMAEYRSAAVKAAVWRLVNEREEKRQAKEAATRPARPRRPPPPRPIRCRNITSWSPASPRADEEHQVEGHHRPAESVINSPLPLVGCRLCTRSAPRCCSSSRTRPTSSISRSPILSAAPPFTCGRCCWSVIPAAASRRFARRLGEVLGLTVWRTDAAESTARCSAAPTGAGIRPSHAIPSSLSVRARSQTQWCCWTKSRRPGTRNDYGRLWDCLLGFLEPETKCPLSGSCAAGQP